MEQSLQAAQDSSSAKEKTVEVWAFLNQWITELHISQELRCFTCLFNIVLSYFELLAKAVFVSKALELQLAAMKADMEHLKQKENPEELTRSAAQLQELQAQWVS